MSVYHNPFEAMTIANGILIKRGLNIHEGDWAKETLSYTCNRKYGEGAPYYEVEIHLTEKGFNEVRATLGTVDYAIRTYSVANDPYIRITITIDSVLSFLTLVHEDYCDAIMAL